MIICQLHRHLMIQTCWINSSTGALQSSISLLDGLTISIPTPISISVAFASVTEIPPTTTRFFHSNGQLCACFFSGQNNIVVYQRQTQMPHFIGLASSSHLPGLIQPECSPPKCSKHWNYLALGTNIPSSSYMELLCRAVAYSWP